MAILEDSNLSVLDYAENRYLHLLVVAEREVIP